VRTIAAAHAIRDGGERRLGRVQAEAEILVRVGGEYVGRLVPLRIPAVADLDAALVLANADRGDDIHEWTRIGVGHVRADSGRIVGRILFVGGFEHPGQRLTPGGHLRVRLELDVDVRFGALFLAHRAVGERHPVVEQHHVVLDHAQPLRFGVFAGTGRALLALQRLPLLDVGAGGLRSGLLIVPEREADRAIGLHVRGAEHPGQFHHQRGAGAVVVRRLAPAVAVHMTADDVHLLRMSRPDLGAEHHLAGARRGRLHVERTQLLVRLLHRIGVHPGRNLVAARATAADRQPGVAATASASGGGWRIVDVLHPLGPAAVALQLHFDPIDRGAIAIRALTPIAEPGQALDGGLVLIEVETLDQRLHRVGSRRVLQAGEQEHCQNAGPHVHPRQRV
jgi:hypothetical protein